MPATAPLTETFTRTLALRKSAADCGLFGTLATGKLRKLVTESRELIEAIAQGSSADIKDEASDISFVWATVMGDLGVPTDKALGMALQYFATPLPQGLTVRSELSNLMTQANTLSEAVLADDIPLIAASSERLTQIWVHVIQGLGYNPAELLDMANAKFARRFGYVMDEMTARGVPPSPAVRPLMINLWDEAKRGEKLTP